MEPERTDDAGSGQQDATRHGFRYSFLHNRSVRARVAGLVFIPLLGALIFGASVFYGAIRDYTTASSVESHTETVRSVLTVIDRLQDERDVSALLRAGVNGDGPVASARDQTDQAIADLTARFEEVPQDEPSPFGNAGAEARETLEMLGDARGVDGSDANIERYRMLIRSLLAVVQASSMRWRDPPKPRRWNAVSSRNSWRSGRTSRMHGIASLRLPVPSRTCCSNRLPRLRNQPIGLPTQRLARTLTRYDAT
jgi:hypothetical protein